ncbi:insulinoma-associated protein 2 [Tachyglossus aculeatus]|uniref:insulinoma-associated protein 2 n=1 Tax=Tachyglossus aculeatus TaxID=9261 RepID=UPI0018F58149|nr:insulinoma-associated protein 2 [Tachyglossus aculeatus]
MEGWRDGGRASPPGLRGGEGAGSRGRVAPYLEPRQAARPTARRPPLTRTATQLEGAWPPGAPPPPRTGQWAPRSAEAPPPGGCRHSRLARGDGPGRRLSYKGGGGPAGAASAAAMPRGFLVKRSKRAGASYRARPAPDEPAGDPRGWADPFPSSGAAALAAGAPPRAPRPPPGPARRAKPPRKPSPADAVTTSPVLGLRIKEEEAAEEPRGGRTPLGEFICQLCKEQYADPLALAQHRCSRIVRVEYRCPDCDKVFSCPANLASHRRWHKPRPPQDRQPVASSSSSSSSPREGKENGGGGGVGGPERAASQHRLGEDSSPGGPEPFPCPCCHRRFRRQAYLRKHLGSHQAPGPALPGPPAEPGPGPGPWPPQVFPCQRCPATFFSGPGLTRHVNKCHPSDARQLLLLLQVPPIRPGCRGGPDACLDHC